MTEIESAERKSVAVRVTADVLGDPDADHSVRHAALLLGAGKETGA